MILDGRKFSQEILAQLKTEVAALPFQPKLVDVVVGDDPVTESYVKIKGKRAAEIGIDFGVEHLPAEISQADLAAKILELNKLENLCGLIIQLPLPVHIDKQAILDLIDPNLDVDVITSSNLGKLFTGQQYFTPATAAAVMALLQSAVPDLSGKKVLMIGAGDLVGKPVAFLLAQAKATVIVANSATQNLKELSQQAEVIISGTGVPNLVTAEMVKPGAMVIDAGTAESAGGITGDVDFAAVEPIASWITPVPGGVGPVTVAMLLKNTVLAAQKLAKLHK